MKRALIDVAIAIVGTVVVAVAVIAFVSAVRPVGAKADPISALIARAFDRPAPTATRDVRMRRRAPRAPRRTRPPVMPPGVDVAAQDPTPEPRIEIVRVRVEQPTRESIIAEWPDMMAAIAAVVPPPREPAPPIAPWDTNPMPVIGAIASGFLFGWIILFVFHTFHRFPRLAHAAHEAREDIIGAAGEIRLWVQDRWQEAMEMAQARAARVGGMRGPR